MNENKEAIMKLIFAIVEDVSKDTPSAREYLQSEGIELPELSYSAWKAQLIAVTESKTGRPFNEKINDIEAIIYWKDGFTPYQTFRETYANENDSE